MVELLQTRFWLALVALWIVSIAEAQPPSPPSHRGLSPVRFSQVLERFVEQQQVNLLADYLAYEESGSVPEASILRESPTLENILQVYGRSVARVGSTLVLRKMPFAFEDEYLRYNEERSLRIFGDLVWRDGRLEVSSKKSEDGTMKITIRASGIPLKQLCEQFQKETGWKLEIDPELQNTRIFARWRSVSPGEVVEAISVLLQTEVETKLMLTEAQKEARKRAKARLLKEDPLAERWRRSDELLQDLLALLSPDEMETFKRGERVDLPLSRLPADVYERALQYVGFAMDVLLNLKPDDDLSQVRDRLREVEIILHLPSVVSGNIFASGIGISVKHPDSGQWNSF